MNSPEIWRDAVPRRSRWILPPALTLGALIALVGGMGWLFLHRPLGQIVDQLALLGAKSYSEHTSVSLMAWFYDAVTAVTAMVVKLPSVPFVVAIVIGLALIALLRRSWVLGVCAIIAFAGANLTTQGIKAWWDRTDFDLYATYGNSWPSGHTTVAAAAVFSLLLLTPARWRHVVALVGAAFIALMAWGTLLGGWHRPSDTVAAICVSAIWYVLVETIRRSVEQVPFAEKIRYPRSTRVMDVLAGICAALGIGILAALILTLPEAPVDSIDRAVQRLAFVGAFFGIAATALFVSRQLLVIGPREVPH